jgi:hypothetical protein
MLAPILIGTSSLLTVVAIYFLWARKLGKQ